jgi:hypothetical protein
VQRLFVLFLIAIAFLAPARTPLRADEPTQQTDQFFAGSVIEVNAEKITVGRTVRGKAETRSFRMTPETQIEGKLEERSRVTVRYSSDENGDTATMVVVRTPAPKKK